MWSPSTFFNMEIMLDGFGSTVRTLKTKIRMWSMIGAQNPMVHFNPTHSSKTMILYLFKTLVKKF